MEKEGIFMAHSAEIIAVGTEILLGNIANTDAQFLSQELSGSGINVFWHTVVGDNPERLREALDIARRSLAEVIAAGLSRLGILTLIQRYSEKERGGLCWF